MATEQSDHARVQDSSYRVALLQEQSAARANQYRACDFAVLLMHVLQTPLLRDLIL
jgi:hypothetical protein